MQTTLPKDLRRKLEAAIVKARDIAESAARTELERLAVGEKTAATYLSDDQRQLRNRLRAHGRQLGDRRKPDGEQAIDRLVTEVAYEHWHRMLFARFLAENDLLIYEDGVTPLSIHDCFELAEEEAGDRTLGWQYAARYAGNMLPQIFRVDSPVFHLGLAPNDQKQLEQLLTSLDQETFNASDALGWVYQFWQSKKKDEVNASEVKIGANELPAVTQLFTEPYMVSFLLDNSLGAWWAGQCLTAQDLASAESEEELRSKAAIPGVPLGYLRFVRHEEGSWTPASGTFEAWPEDLGDLKTLDPCCGSGHFLIATFLMLVPMRMEREGISASAAVDGVLRENIHALELDQRCVELAVFALALAAWKYPNAGGYRVLPELNVACSGLSIGAKKDDWLSLAGDNTNLGLALDEIYRQFKDAPVLGTLIDPMASLGKGSLFELEWVEVGPLLNKALAVEKDDEKAEMGVVARGMAKAAGVLADKFFLVTTNVPYLTRSKFSTVLRDYTESFHGDTNADLATAMIDRFGSLIHGSGVLAVVSPQNWLFQPAYKKFRKKTLSQYSWCQIARLGFGSFNTPLNAAPSLFIATASQSRKLPIYESDAVNALDIDAKNEVIVRGELIPLDQGSALTNKDYMLDRFGGSGLPNLSESIDVFQGIRTGDKQRFTLFFWEVILGSEWDFMQSTCQRVKHWDGLSQCIRWENGKGQLHQYAEATREKLHDMHESGNLSWGKIGVTISQMGNLESALYSGEKYDGNCATITSKNTNLATAIWCFCSSLEYQAGIRAIDQSIKVTNATLGKIPFDEKKWLEESSVKYPKGLPKPYSDDPAQWIFHGHPCGSVVWDEGTKCTAHGLLRSDDTVLQVAVVRLLGYRWPAELDRSMELAAEQREWANGCEVLLSLADDDGIACIPAVRGEQPAHQRIEALLQAAYGEQWSISIRDKLLESVGCKNKSLDFWLREKFFEQHCKLYQHRPFVWHIWDGLKDGFAALVNYHQLDRKNLERLIYTYLDDWIRTQKQDQSDGVDGAGVRLAAAQGLKRRLEQILEGEAPYDIFVRWKPLEQQLLGWEPDVNDGVRLNIRPFLGVEDVGKKGAGILRAKPNIKWNKDRGKDVPSAPWYSLGLEYGEAEGARINDHHLTLADKKAAPDA